MYQDFPSKLLCFTVRRIFVGESFTVALISGTEKDWMKRGGGMYHGFASTILCLLVPKITVGESFTVALFSGSEKIWRGSLKIFRRNFYLSQCGDFSLGSPLLLH